jgi:hypothetical protein
VTLRRGRHPVYAGRMADSDVVRARRRRAHLAGDHRVCGPRCTARRAAVAAAVPQCETVSEAVAAFSAAVAGWPDEDPRRTELALARLIAGRLDSGEAEWRAGEHLVMMMRSLAIEPEREADVIDEIRARGAARQIERMAREARGEQLPVHPGTFRVDGEEGTFAG